MLQTALKMHNRFDFEIYDLETGVKETAQAENIILDRAWGNINGMMRYVYIGTGTGTLSPTRQSLFNQLAKKDAGVVESVFDTPYKYHHTRYVTFSETEANGLWSEIGVSDDWNYNRISTHALITDSEGNPITINKTNTKIVTVYATVYSEVTVDSTNQLSVPPYGLLRRYSAGLVGATPYILLSGLLQTNGNVSFLGVLGRASASFTYDFANMRHITNLVRFAVDAGNGDVRGILLGESSAINQALWLGATAIPNAIFSGHTFTNVSVGTGDGVTTEFDLPKGHYVAGTEVIKVNGVVKTAGVDYTARSGMRSTDTMLIDIPCGNIPVGDFDEIIVLPQPASEADKATITSIVFQNGTANNSNANFRDYDVKLSVDGETWVNGGAGGLSFGQKVTLSSFAPAKYNFMKAKFGRWSSPNDTWDRPFTPSSGYSAGCLNYFRIMATPPAQKMIKFASPPASGAPITADFTVDYIPKSPNFVLDVQAETQFAEGV